MRSWWGRRGRWSKIGLIILAVLVVFGIIGALASPSDESDDTAAPETTTVVVTEEATTAESTTEEEAAEETTTEEAEPAPPPEPAAPKPIVLRGNGAQVETIRLTENTPLVVTGRHRGSANFIVHLVGRGGGGEIFLFNEIGNYKGQLATGEAKAGRYRVSVEADGNWGLRFEQPVPGRSAKAIPGAISGRGAEVVRLRSSEDLQPIVMGRHRGQANFIVHLFGYGDLQGEIFLFNEIGNYRGETIAEEMPAGDYLLAVQADGPWMVRFTR